MGVEGRGQLVVVSSLPCGDQTGVLRMGSKLLYPLNHIASPRYATIYEPMCQSNSFWQNLVGLPGCVVNAKVMSR